MHLSHTFPSVAGPVLFISFTTLASFVVLNMLIAIISEQYELSAAKYRAVHQVT